jgi:hypothetical protein
VEEFQQRVLQEKEDLQLKRDKLEQFTHSTSFGTLSIEERARLQRQLVVMGEYLAILNSRIVNFT